MEEMHQITIAEWMRWKEDIREKLKETAENFVYIGYRLKQIRDSGMYGGAADVFEFAQREYGLGKSTVSRFIAINEKFSEGGNSERLQEPYRMIGSSKLAEMLTLTDEECTLITEKTTVAQIRELKEFNRQEPEEGKTEAGGAEESEAGESVRTPLQKCIIEYFRGKKDLLDEVMKHMAAGDSKSAAELISPNGNTTFKKGIVFLFMYDYQTGVKYKTFGSGDIMALNWEEFLALVLEIYQPRWIPGVSCYDRFYGKPEKEIPKVEETPERRNEAGSVATSQQKEKEEENHVEEMEDEEEPESGDEEGDGEAAESADPAEQGDNEDGAGGEAGEIEDPDVVYMGKCSIADIAMGIPKPTKEEVDRAKGRTVPVGLDDPDDELDDPDDEWDDPEEDDDDEWDDFETKHPEIKGYKAAIKNSIEILQYIYDRKDWPGIIKTAEKIIWRAEQIQKIQSREGK